MYQAQRYTMDKQWRSILQLLGLNEQAVLSRARLPIDLLGQANFSLDANEYFRLWQAIDEMLSSNRPAPLILAEAIRFDMFSPPLMAAACSPDFVTCVARLQEFKPLIGPLVFDIASTEHELSITIRSVIPGSKLHTFVVASEFVFLTGLIRHSTGNSRIRPLRIESCEPLVHDEFTEYFGVRPKRGDENRIVFAASDARLHFQTENESLWNFFEPELRRRLEELDVDATFAARVRACLMELLPQGKSSIEDVAERLCVSKRTLQRRLSDEETRYQQVLNHSRELLARHYLTSSNMTSAEISFLLGYDEPSSFSRAFHVWTGMTAEALRKEAV